MTKAYRRKECRLCNGKELQMVLKLADTPLADSYITDKRLGFQQEVYPIELYKCLSCGHVQMGHVIDIEEVYLDYIYETVSSPGLIKHFQLYADQCFQQFDIKSGDFAVDIGSNDGTLLSFFKEKGLNVLGIDPAKETARKATDAGIETLPQFFSVDLARQIKKKYGAANLITANNIVADVDDVQEMINGIRELLAPEGVFRFESFYFLDQVRNLVFDFTYHEHFSYFTVKVLKKFFKTMGMELLDSQRVGTKGGSIRCSIQLEGGRYPVSESVQNLIDEEDSFGMGRLSTYEDYNLRISHAREESLNLLDRFKSKGSKIVGFGASATSTTLIYHFGLGNYFEYLVDDYKAKQGLYSPGLHIPVFPPEKIYQTKPDIVYILAWRYHLPIVERYSQFIENGGIFVVPLPKLKIISR